MKVKLNSIVIGSILALSFLIPQGYARIFSLEVADLLIVLIFFILLFSALKNEKYEKKLFLQIDYLYWFIVIGLFTFSFLIYGVNFTTIRFIFYNLVGLLFYIYIKSLSIKEIQYLFSPTIFVVVIVNLIASIFELSYLDNTVGWISYYFENPNFINRGRLAGFQGSGPNVAGSLFSLILFVSFYLHLKIKNNLYLIFSIISAVLVLLTYSRGSYLALFVSVSFLIFVNYRSSKIIISSYILSVITASALFFNFSSDVLLKESDRGFLTNIALENIKIFKGYGGGNYVETIYKDYFLSINPEILNESLNINLNKVELGITPEEYRDSNVDFFIGTSQGGFEILVQSFIINECSEDRITCQHLRIDKETLINFISSIAGKPLNYIETEVNDSECLSDDSSFISRGEFACVLQSMKVFNNESSLIRYKDINDSTLQQRFNYLDNNDLFVPCEETASYACPNREMAVGELAVIVENITLNKKIVPLENYRLFCTECEFRNVNGYIKLVFDKYDGFLPRSTISFYTSTDAINWNQIGFTRTTGSLINFNPNHGYIEIGGHSDGQSFGNTFFDSEIKELLIIRNNTTESINFVPENNGVDFFVYNPNSTEPYNANITYTENGLRLFRPNKYWVAVPNNDIFNNDFEIILNLTLPEIPWEKQTVISNTSLFTNETQSWKFEIDDGRPFFYWADEDGVYRDTNVLGDKSLRSGVLIQKNGKLSNTKPPIVDPSYLSQLTTAHNGYLTFSVEYGLVFAILFYTSFLFSIFYILKMTQKLDYFIFATLIIFTIQNFTNDMVYSPDMYLLFNLCLAFNFYLIKPASKMKL